ncbi:phosphoenolpyruvate synthetase regulatory protein [Gammaproteobacteria bacterium]
MSEWTIFFVSDHTGVTAEAMGNSLLSQFSGLCYKTLTIPFVTAANLPDVLQQAVAAMPAALIFSTLTNPTLREHLAASGVPLFDLFTAFSAPLSGIFNQPPKYISGRVHGANRDYDNRIEAVNFALALDDGLCPHRLPEAQLILTGVSRAGKTPTALYLALQYGVPVANYPLTPEDLDDHHLPPSVQPHLSKLRGLTLSAERLTHIRQERYPNSRYASLTQCRTELAAAEKLFTRHAIPVIDTTHLSVEEIAARLRSQIN